MNVFSKVAVIASLVGATTMVAANTGAVNQQALTPTQISTVQQALTLKDDTPIKLKGYIVKAIGDEKYQFSDQTGSITVDIDDELWQGKPISAKTPVTIIGEIDIDYKPKKRVEVDVDQVQF
ncbi:MULTISPECIES: NirD/YgiW/YdeI family stress tolerance protein [Acinetobacter]|uniref:NirD/YgiW/YdeI family stress tolerance protein n=2 Tax=Acinetobacter haemolyticus TaxID=29430 RepID=A0A2K8PWI6_ACIHA|nr:MULTISPECIES: NirD/YgiW/YdeI family stress tolerance protein [Acinetobacter]ATZ67108.1 hypothetical protein BSR56_06950 [Acinetobacter haemolyticus]AZN69333.1 NirD/YgiW/YdeI family stress tolerance protein [Acinetobacter haemolyticus]EEH67418.1 putative TIGR00156 family protein [Acinetobacter sp. ATCC 27244]ENW18655.1 TIGR00156 family protein [Acinetobacter haemolyticus CIP 64.3 = MTCC 9819]ENW18768.1 TIGR00156 family protein [Acinetobacter haemolyticus NIPH 261]